MYLYEKVSIIFVSAFIFYAYKSVNGCESSQYTVKTAQKRESFNRSIDWVCVCVHIVHVYIVRKSIKITFNNIYEFERITSVCALVCSAAVAVWILRWTIFTVALFPCLIEIFICHFMLLECNLHIWKSGIHLSHWLYCTVYIHSCARRGECAHAPQTADERTL